VDQLLPRPQNDKNVAIDAPSGAPSDGPEPSANVEMNPHVLSPAVTNVIPPSRPSPNIPHADATLVDFGPAPTPAPAPVPSLASAAGSYQKTPHVHLEDHMAMDPSPVVKKVVSMFRDTLVGLTDILETVGREDAKRVAAHAPPSVSAPPSSTLTTSSTHLRPEPDASTSTSASLVVSELLDEIKGLRQQLEEDKQQKEERNREVKRLQSEMDALRREVGMLDFGAAVQTQTQTTDDDGVIDMDISPSSSVPASPSTFSTPTTAWRKRRLRDLDDADRIHSPHPLAHLLTPDFPLPLRLPQRMSRASITPLVPPFGGESSRASIASTPVISTPPPKDSLSSSLTSLRTPSPAPRPVPYDGIPLPIKSQRKQHMFFHSDRQQN